MAINLEAAYNRRFNPPVDLLVQYEVSIALTRLIAAELPERAAVICRR